MANGAPIGSNGINYFGISVFCCIQNNGVLSNPGGWGRPAD